MGNLAAVTMWLKMFGFRDNPDNPELFAVIFFPKDMSGTFTYEVCKETLNCTHTSSRHQVCGYAIYWELSSAEKVSSALFTWSAFGM